MSCTKDDAKEVEENLHLEGVPVITITTETPLFIKEGAAMTGSISCTNGLEKVTIYRAVGSQKYELTSFAEFEDNAFFAINYAIDVASLLSNNTGLIVEATDSFGNIESEELAITFTAPPAPVYEPEAILNVDAFPGAQGHGRYVTGGRGGRVIYVTTLLDTGNEGSLRYALNEEGARTIVFNVGGTIELGSPLKITEGNVTIAGQTAPGDGICLKNYELGVSADNVIIRYLRVRLGDEKKVEADAMGGRFHKNIIIDHCSMSWSVDECVSFYSNENTTVQWCLVSESLTNSVHIKDAHGYGGIWGGVNATFHHNLLAHHSSRTPRFGPGVPTQGKEVTDFRNNVIYNWGGNGCYGGEAMDINIVNNYYKPGPATPSKSKRGRIFAVDKKTNLTTSEDFYPINDKWGRVFAEGNIIDASTSTGSDATICQNATSDNWTYGIYNQIGSGYNITAEEKAAIRMTAPFATGGIVTEDASTAYQNVLNYVGASIVRDAIDLRIINEVKEGTATYTGSISSILGLIDSPSDVGGFPNLSNGDPVIDTDKDGMPDSWEDANGLDKTNEADGRLKPDGAVYTNLEVYLNGLVSQFAQ